MKYINAYSDKKNIYLQHRDESGQKRSSIIADFDWYFYLDRKGYDLLNKVLTKSTKEETKKAKDKFREMYGIERTEKGEKYVKVYADYEKYRESRLDFNAFLSSLGIITYEDDVDLSKRYVLDTPEVEVEDNYRVLYFDIETDDRDQKIEIGKSRIVSLGAYDGKNEYWFCDNDEKLILRQFLDLIKDYDVIIGWNSAEFDVEYIKARMLLYGIHYDWRSIIHIDFMKRFMHVYRYDRKITSFSLDNISKFFLQEGKIKTTDKIWSLFQNDWDQLKRYNMNDCILLYKLNEKLKMLELMIRECVWCKVFLSRFYITELLDCFILQYSKQLDIHLISKKNNEDKKAAYQGGFVLKTEPGLFTDIVVFDFKSLYPNIIRSFNISPETLSIKPTTNCISGSKPNVYFDKSKRGILPLVVEYFLDKRKDLQSYKNELVHLNKKDTIEYQKTVSDEIVVKELANSIYGTTGSIYSRYFDINIAESITLIGQHCLKFSREFFESLGYKAVAGDTDSIFINIKPGTDIDKLLDDFHIALEKHLIETYNIDKSTIQFKNEKYFSRFINLVKKNYVGRLRLLESNEVDEVYAKGIEMIKKDSIKYAKALQKDVITKILYEDHDVEYYVKYVTDLKETFKTVSVNVDDIKISHRISKGLDTYKSLPPHIRLAKRIWETGNKDFYIGMEMQYVITDSTDKTGERTGVIHVSEYAGKFDRAYYWNHRVYPLVKRILKAVYQCVDWDQYDDLYPIERKKRTRKKKQEIAVEIDTAENESELESII